MIKDRQKHRMIMDAFIDELENFGFDDSYEFIYCVMMTVEHKGNRYDVVPREKGCTIIMTGWPEMRFKTAKEALSFIKQDAEKNPNRDRARGVLKDSATRRFAIAP